MGVVSDAAPEIGHALGCQLAPRVLGSQFRTWSGRPAYPGSTLAAPGVRSGGGPGISIGGACGGGWGLPAAKNGGFCIKKRSGPDSIACVTRWRQVGGAGGFLPLSSIAELVSQLQSGQQPTQQLGQPTMQVVHAQAQAVHAAVTTAAHAPAPEPQPTVPEGVPPTFNKEVVQQTF
jgi:hypothetical protein